MVGTRPDITIKTTPSLFVSLLMIGLLSGPGLIQAEAPPTAKKPVLPPSLTKEVPDSIEDLRTIQKEVKAVLEKVKPAVVAVQVGNAAGSGVIVRKDGLILTAGHVSGKPDQNAFVIFADGRRVRAKSLGRNEGIDSGMMQITEPGDYPFVEMGKSADVTRGQWCLTIGHPGGFKPGRTPVVRLGRVLQVNRFLIQTDCTLVGGDSGGPLFDLAGNLIGIHSRIGGQITDNIHVPIDTYTDTWDRLVSGEEWGLFSSSRSSAYLGVRLDDLPEGCKIDEITKESPAAKAGLQVGDFILDIDGKKIKEQADLASQMSKQKVGDVVNLKIRRGTDEMTIKVTLGRNNNRRN